MSTSPDVIREVLALVRDSLRNRRGEVADDSWIEERARNLTTSVTLEFEVARIQPERCRHCGSQTCAGTCIANVP